jgi:hypothetical protein
MLVPMDAQLSLFPDLPAGGPQADQLAISQERPGADFPADTDDDLNGLCADADDLREWWQIEADDVGISIHASL